MRIVVVVSLWLLCACANSSGKSDVADAAVAEQRDAGANTVAASCTGDCATVTLTATFGDTTRSFDRAFFGLSSPAMSDSGDWEIYIENNAGQDDQCPTVSSPSPLFVLIITGLDVPQASAPIVEVSGISTLVDFESALLGESVFEKASANTLTWVAADACQACAEGSEPDRSYRMIAFDIDATFASGSISGHSYATHCASLDKL